jgi:hypothetical protein
MTNLTTPLEKRQLKIEKIRRAGALDFYYFTKFIFAKSFDNFILGDYIKETCEFLQNNPKTIRVSARVHFKSLSLYAYVMWLVLRMRYTHTSMEGHYFSYKSDMAKYHLGDPLNIDNIKSLIARNPYFHGIRDNKAQAESIINYTWDGISNFAMKPAGMLSFKRGLHCNGPVLIDDALHDPAEKLDPRTVKRINTTFFAQILDIPIGDRPEIHVVGTAQTDRDFYFDERVKEEGFKVKVMPALSNLKTDEYGWIIDGTPLWKEWMDLDTHKRKQKGRGIKVYAQEYLCDPAYSANTFFKKWQFEALPKVEQKLTTDYNPEVEVVAGWDLGKHSHPAHFTVIEKRGDARVQVFDKWFDGVDYTEQLDFIKDKVNDLNIDNVYYDATRGELEVLTERGELPAEFVGISFTRKIKFALATEFEKAVTNKKLSIIDNDRTIDQICTVDNELNAPETKDGHGDSFFSFSLAFADRMQAEPELYISVQKQ